MVDEEAIDKITSDIQTDLIVNINTQMDKQDINFTRTMSNNTKPIEIDGMKGVIVDTGYAGIQEFGLPAGTTPNYDALLNWVRGKLKFYGDDAFRVTHMIQNKIAKEGIPAKRFVKKAIKSLMGKRTPRARTKKTKDPTREAKKTAREFKKINKNVKRARKVIQAG